MSKTILEHFWVSTPVFCEAKQTFPEGRSIPTSQTTFDIAKQRIAISSKFL
jgi:hypothetical protein